MKPLYSSLLHFIGVILLYWSVFVSRLQREQHQPLLATWTTDTGQWNVLLYSCACIGTTKYTHGSLHRWISFHISGSRERYSKARISRQITNCLAVSGLYWRVFSGWLRGGLTHPRALYCPRASCPRARTVKGPQTGQTTSESTTENSPIKPYFTARQYIVIIAYSAGRFSVSRVSWNQLMQVDLFAAWKFFVLSLL